MVAGITSESRPGSPRNPHIVKSLEKGAIKIRRILPIKRDFGERFAKW
jgi:hypothetical protein